MLGRVTENLKKKKQQKLKKRSSRNEKPEEEMETHQPSGQQKLAGDREIAYYSYGRNRENVRSFSPNRTVAKRTFHAKKRDELGMIIHRNAP